MELKMGKSENAQKRKAEIRMKSQAHETVWEFHFGECKKENHRPFSSFALSSTSAAISATKQENEVKEVSNGKGQEFGRFFSFSFAFFLAIILSNEMQFLIVSIVQATGWMVGRRKRYELPKK